MTSSLRRQGSSEILKTRPRGGFFFAPHTHTSDLAATPGESSNDARLDGIPRDVSPTPERLPAPPSPRIILPMTCALFPALLGDDAWYALPPAVRAMHGTTARLEARGLADVTGAGHLPARCLRRLLGLPAPGPQQTLALTIERRGTRETWTRRFPGRNMQSVLDRRTGSPLLYERLGPARLGFTLRRDGDAIDWQLRSLHVLGMPVPRALRGRVLSRSGMRDGRYHFLVDVQLPLLGRLIAYDGWLEPLSDDA